MPFPTVNTCSIVRFEGSAVLYGIKRFFNASNFESLENLFVIEFLIDKTFKNLCCAVFASVIDSAGFN